MIKTTQKMLMLMTFISSLIFATTITTSKTSYPAGNSAWIKVDDKPNNYKDWVGIYPAGSSTAWKNVVQWKWARNPSPAQDAGDWYEFQNLADGSYEARFFLNNTYAIEDSIAFSVGNALGVTTKKVDYAIDEKVSVTVNGILSGNKDWVGIYPKDASSSWGNVIAWNWVTQSTVILDKIKKPMPVGEYEVRLFFNNSTSDADIKAKQSFSVIEKVSISTSKDKYTVSENITVKINKQAKDQKNWIGIYPEGASNSWSNVVVWQWTNGDNTVLLDGVAQGNYEARLFYNNSFKLEAKTTFSVSSNQNNYIYGSEGAYLNKVKINDDSDKYRVYYPEGHVQNAPLVLVVGYRNTMKGVDDNYRRLEGAMKYLASLGCYVIGHKEIAQSEGWTDTQARKAYFIDAVENAKKLGVDTSKLAILGKSAGGMHAYALMQYFKQEKGYGSKKSFVIDLIGYYALNMRKNDLAGLNIDSLVLHYGGYTGVQTTWPQDPRTLLTLSHILKHDNFKTGFIVLNTDNHGYESGDYNAFKTKHDLMEPIDAMIKYEFFNQDGKYDNATELLFSKYNQTTSLAETETLKYLNGRSSEEVYGGTRCRQIKDIDYCSDYK